ncbi:GLPGLI family protein [Marinilabiliaceae bacterium JC040]|nr:GLPGLI family protein [Marinilabiliaceae bacterium JC040]
MKTKVFLLVSLFYLSISALNAQVSVNIVGGGSKVDKEIIDKAFLECQYNYSFLSDISKPKERTEDRMILQIGKNRSKYFSYTNLLIDSIMRSNISTEEKLLKIKKFKTTVTSTIYKNFKKNKVSFVDKIFMTDYKCTEEIPDFKWNIKGEYSKILGYECQKATCKFRGREYTAWFTKNLPINNGPWKFHGLPGLIMKVVDSENHFQFTIVGIRKLKDTPISFPKKQYLNTSIKKFQKVKTKFNENPIAFIKGVVGSSAKIKITGKDGSSLKKINGKNVEKIKFENKNQYIEREL